MRKILLFIFFIFIGCGTSDSNIIKENNIANYTYQKMLRLGIDVNWAQFSWLIKDYNSSFPKIFSDIGFKTIRLRFDFTDKVLENFDNNKTKYLNYLKKIVNDCETSNLNVVLANGASEFKENPNDETLNNLINNWMFIAKGFKSYPYNVSYNFIIEPGKNLKQHNDLLNEFYQSLYSKIRSFDKKRILIWAPNYISNPYYLPQTWYPKNDKYVMAEWHMYAAGPKEGYEDEIPQKTKFAYDWSIKNQIPTWVGAWMPGNYNKGDTYTIYEQIKFSKLMINTLKKYHIPSAINADTQFFDYDNFKFREDRIEVLKTIINTYYSK